MVADWFVSLLVIAFFIERLSFCGFCLGCSQQYLFVEQNSQININVRLSLLLQWASPSLHILGENLREAVFVSIVIELLQFLW